MSKNRFEEKQLRQINNTNKLMNEGFLAKAIVRFLYGSKVKKLLKKGVEIAKDDPELQAAFADMKYQAERLQDLVDSHCDDFPNSRHCK